jgi:hypothetical protein
MQYAHMVDFCMEQWTFVGRWWTFVGRTVDFCRGIGGLL